MASTRGKTIGLGLVTAVVLAGVSLGVGFALDDGGPGQAAAGSRELGSPEVITLPEHLDDNRVESVDAALAGLSFDVPVPPPMLDFSEMGRIRQ